MNRVVFSGEGINLKTGKPIKFHVSEAISTKALESLMRNVELPTPPFSSEDPRVSMRFIFLTPGCMEIIAHTDCERKLLEMTTSWRV
jgi:hypothetical protein